MPVPAANALMSRADADLSADRLSLYNQAEQLLVTNVAWITLSQQKLFWNVPSYVHGFTLSAQGFMPLGDWGTFYLTAHE